MKKAVNPYREWGMKKGGSGRPLFKGYTMKGFRFYHISEHYIRYLHSIDNRVQWNKGERSPYVGIVLSIKGMNYYVPLESPKPGHAKLKSGGAVLRLDGGNLGLMGFNNMIPVLPECLKDFDIAGITDQKYKMLLYNQLDFCNENRDLIIRRAETTYRKETSGNVPYYKKVCCNFRKLERKIGNYDPDYKAHKKR